MQLSQILASADFFHDYAKYSQRERRQLYGNVFGTELPAYVIFHAMLGYVLLGVGLAALILRLPVDALRRRRSLHRHLGYAWIFGTIWMPVTAIWCIYSFTGWNVVAFFIFSMFAAIQIGWLCIQCFKFSQGNDADRSVSAASTSVRKLCKILHGLFMMYSLIMLLGAGISFPFRANADFSDKYKAYDARS